MEMHHSFGWLPDYPDYRDLTPESTKVSETAHTNVAKSLKSMKLEGSNKVTLPTKQDLRPWCPPIEDQANLGSCTANAGVGLLEYFENRAFGLHHDASRLFLYKVTRNLLGWTGDTGAFLRTTMGAMRLFGIPPEKYLPYNANGSGSVNPDWDEEPSSFLYSYAKNYQAIRYFRLDIDVNKKELLTRIKRYLAGNYPSMFGFTVYSSIAQANDDGCIPFPSAMEKMEGGHAVVAIGYDDNKKITNKINGATTKGALLIRNSWGTEWGEEGYGWLPYDYVLQGLATDWWTLITSDWVNTNQFGF
ncbi:cysteine protease, papain C1 family [Legionella lansingensis]|uniref:Cysteine protease n=1 Tax=Legionella lansingensis TaxID=45067 RepID=A0A0W0VHK9_9GAMM|nr:C1 family peptidase [Legionella lansingensis]KTD19599.1 cysteine protease [Legionella lansingensis]SNV50178.1 cysteine protease, papain C1 family [Legionella lansingensis]